jgi:sRNA-binding carbon storage regulator CsrA
MALVLKRKENEAVYINDTPLVVTEIRTPMDYTVEVRSEFLTNQFVISERHGVEVTPGVYVSAGHNTDPEAVKLVFRAPQSAKIYREEIYLERKQGKRHKA